MHTSLSHTIMTVHVRVLIDNKTNLSRDGPSSEAWSESEPLSHRRLRIGNSDNLVLSIPNPRISYLLLISKRLDRRFDILPIISFPFLRLRQWIASALEHQISGV